MRYLSSRGAVSQPRSPRINWLNPITRGLWFAWCGTNPFHELVTGLEGTSDDQSRDLKWGPLGMGMGNIGPTFGYYFYMKQSLSYPYTVLTVYSDPLQGASGLTCRPFTAANTNSWQGCFWDLIVNPTTNGGDCRPYFNVYYNNGLTGTAAISPVNKTSVRYNLTGGACTKAQKVQLWHQGRMEDEQQVAGTPNSFVPGSQGIIGIADRIHFGHSGQWKGPTYAAWIWARELSPAEHLSMYLNPWQVFA